MAETGFRQAFLLLLVTAISAAFVAMIRAFLLTILLADRRGSALALLWDFDGVLLAARARARERVKLPVSKPATPIAAATRLF